MKKLSIFAILLSLTIAFSMNANAQSWKDIKKKAKNKTKNKINKIGNKKETNTSNSNNSNTENNTTKKTSVTNITKDQEYIDFVDKHYKLIYYKHSDELAVNNISGNGYGIINGLKHKKAAQELNYPEVLKHLQEKGNKGGVSEKKYNALLNYGEEYKKAFNADKGIKFQINNRIDQAYAARANNVRTAINHIEDALAYAEGYQYIVPDFENAATFKKEVETAFNDIAGKYFEKVYTSDFHKEHAGTILFSDRPIIVGEEDPEQFKTEFTINDNIYAMVYLASTVEDQCGKSGQYYVTWDGGGGANYSNITFKHNQEDLDKSYYPIEIIPHPDKAIHGIDAKQFALILSRFSPRNHELTVEFTGNREVRGTIKINLAGMDADKLKANAEKAVSNAQDNYAKNRQLPPYFKRPTQKFSDSELSQANMKALLKRAWDNCAEVKKVVVLGNGTADDWIIRKNDLDIPTHKSTNPEIIAIYKGKDGWCYFVENISFKREYAGGGKYTKVKYYGSGYHAKIDCANIK